MVGQSMFCFRCGNNNQNARLFSRQCCCYFRCNEGKSVTTERTIITDYFYLGLRYSRIVQLLSKYHGIQMSKSILKRRLKEYNLKKHDNVPVELLHCIIQREVIGPAAFSGYRKILRHLRSRYKLNIPRDNLMNILKEVDPEGTEIRRSPKFCRQKYISPGPDHCWHTNGLDKLKPFGLRIHEAIDGFSRKVIWLRVTKTNNNPSVAPTFYVDALKKEKKAPSILRSGCGTESGAMAAIQCYLHQNTEAHKFSTSVSNQRIENWLSFMRRDYASWIINFFKGLVHEGSLLPRNYLHMECV